MDFQKKLVECSIVSISKALDRRVLCILLDLVLRDVLSCFSELEEQFEYLNLNAEHVVVGQLEKRVGFRLQELAKLAAGSSHRQVLLRFDHQNVDSLQDRFNDLVLFFANIPILLDFLDLLHSDSSLLLLLFLGLGSILFEHFLLHFDWVLHDVFEHAEVDLEEGDAYLLAMVAAHDTNLVEEVDSVELLGRTGGWSLS